MAEETPKYCMWIDWHQAIVSFHPIQGYELIQFSSRENFLYTDLIFYAIINPFLI